MASIGFLLTKNWEVLFLSFLLLKEIVLPCYVKQEELGRRRNKVAPSINTCLTLKARKAT
jgi:hypothetical protein